MEIHLVEAGSRIIVKDVCIMIPEVDVAVFGSKNCVVITAFYSEDLCTADLLTPGDLISIRVNYSEFSLAGSE